MVFNCLAPMKIQGPRWREKPNNGGKKNNCWKNEVKKGMVSKTDLDKQVIKKLKKKNWRLESKTWSPRKKAQWKKLRQANLKAYSLWDSKNTRLQILRYKLAITLNQAQEIFLLQKKSPQYREKKTKKNTHIYVVRSM